MIRTDIITIGRMRNKAQSALWDDYHKRMKWPLTLHEIEAKSPQDEEKKILAKLAPHSFLFIMDERGKSLSSPDFAKKLQDIAHSGQADIQFVIGGADGLAPSLRERANFILSFGQQTWPHMLARIMLIEQIYRAQQILEGHPYHRN